MRHKRPRGTIRTKVFGADQVLPQTLEDSKHGTLQLLQGKVLPQSRVIAYYGRK